MKCEYGLCLVCEKEIVKTCKECGAKTPSEAYTTVELPWSNGSKMQMAVCIDCSKEKVWKADKMEMTKAVWDAWDKTHGTYPKDVVIVDA